MARHCWPSIERKRSVPRNRNRNPRPPRGAGILPRNQNSRFPARPPRSGVIASRAMRGVRVRAPSAPPLSKCLRRRRARYRGPMLAGTSPACDGEFEAKRCARYERRSPTPRLHRRPALGRIRDAPEVASSPGEAASLRKQSLVAEGLEDIREEAGSTSDDDGPGKRQRQLIERCGLRDERARSCSR